MFIIKLIKKYPIFFVLLLIGIIISIISGLVIVAIGFVIVGIIIMAMNMKKIKEPGEIVKHLQKPIEESEELRSNIYQLKQIIVNYLMIIGKYFPENQSKIQIELRKLYDDHDRIIEHLPYGDIENLLDDLHSIKTDIFKIITKKDKKDLKKINKEFDNVKNNIYKIINIAL